MKCRPISCIQNLIDSEQSLISIANLNVKLLKVMYINWGKTIKLGILLWRAFWLWVCLNSLDSQICYFTEFKRVPIVDPTPTMEVYPQRENSENETVITSSGDLVLNNGENFTIECFGDYPIELIIQRGSKRAVCINQMINALHSISDYFYLGLIHSNSAVNFDIEALRWLLLKMQPNCHTSITSHK